MHNETDGRKPYPAVWLVHVADDDPDVLQQVIDDCTPIARRLRLRWLVLISGTGEILYSANHDDDATST